jgi:hypothetical protein
LFGPQRYLPQTEFGVVAFVPLTEFGVEKSVLPTELSSRPERSGAEGPAVFVSS